MEEEYKEININDYVRAGLENGLLKPVEAEKYSRIIARQGKEGEKVVSWSVDQNGNEVQEKIAFVERDQNTNNLGWIALKVDENGKEIVDENGHANKWVIDDSTFQKKYEADDKIEGMFKPKGGPQMFVQISDNIILEQGGSKMKIASGGYINITNIDDMYGISERDFNDTYKIIKERTQKL